MKTMTTSKLRTEARTPWRMESAPSDGPTVRSSRYLIEAGRAPARSTRARSCADSWLKFHQCVLNPRCGFGSPAPNDLLLEHDGHLAAAILFGEWAKAPRRFTGEDEIDLHCRAFVLRLSVALRRSRPVTTGVRLSTYQFSPVSCDFACAIRCGHSRFPCRGENPGVGGKSGGFEDRDWDLHQLQFQLPAGLNHLFGTRRIAFTGELHENFVVLASVRLNGGFGKARALIRRSIVSSDWDMVVSWMRAMALCRSVNR